MRENVLQTWTPAAWLVLIALVLAGAVVTGRYRVGTAEARQIVDAPLYCAAPSAAAFRRVAESGRAARPGGSAAMLLVLMAQHGRFAGPSR
jgi:hypothetical protein